MRQFSSDYKNAPLLFRYAGLTAFVLDSAREYLSEHQPLLSHPIPHASFLLWLIWFVSTYSEFIVLLIKVARKSDTVKH